MPAKASLGVRWTTLAYVAAILVFCLAATSRDTLSADLASQRKCYSRDRPGFITCGTAISQANREGGAGVLAAAHLISYRDEQTHRLDWVWVVSYHRVPDYFLPFGGCVLIDEWVSVNARKGGIQSDFGGGAGRCP